MRMIVINPLIFLNISFVKTKFKICPFERFKIIVNGRSEIKLIEWVIRNKMIILGLQISIIDGSMTAVLSEMHMGVFDLPISGLLSLL